MLKQDKIELVKNLTEDLKEAKAVVLVDYMGLSVKSQQDLKKQLREVGCGKCMVFCSSKSIRIQRRISKNTKGQAYHNVDLYEFRTNEFIRDPAERFK